MLCDSLGRMGTSRAPGTAEKILDVSERLVQLRGYNAFSYADVAKAVGIRKASLHHHFATKADLGRALVVRYREAFLSALARDRPRRRQRLGSPRAIRGALRLGSSQEAHVHVRHAGHGRGHVAEARS